MNDTLMEIAICFNLKQRMLLLDGGIEHEIPYKGMVQFMPTDRTSFWNART